MVTVKPLRLPEKLKVRLGSTAVGVLLVTFSVATSTEILGAVVLVGAGVTTTALVFE